MELKTSANNIQTIAVRSLEMIRNKQTGRDFAIVSTFSNKLMCLGEIMGDCEINPGRNISGYTDYSKKGVQLYRNDKGDKVNEGEKILYYTSDWAISTRKYYNLVDFDTADELVGRGLLGRGYHLKIIKEVSSQDAMKATADLKAVDRFYSKFSHDQNAFGELDVRDRVGVSGF